MCISFYSESGRPEDETVEFTWDEYLELTGATPVPHDAFKHVGCYGFVTPLKSVCVLSYTCILRYLFVLSLCKLYSTSRMNLA